MQFQTKYLLFFAIFYPIHIVTGLNSIETKCTKITAKQEDDIQACTAIFQQPENKKRLFFGYSDKQIKNHTKNAASLFNTSLWALKEDTSIVACGICTKTTNSTHIDMLAVRSEKKRQGFGLALITHLIKAHKPFSPCISLTVENSNIAAKKLYEKVGFAPDETTRHGDFVQYKYPAIKK